MKLSGFIYTHSVILFHILDIIELNFLVVDNCNHYPMLKIKLLYFKIFFIVILIVEYILLIII